MNVLQTMQTNEGFQMICIQSMRDKKTNSKHENLTMFHNLR